MYVIYLLYIKHTVVLIVILLNLLYFTYLSICDTAYKTIEDEIMSIQCEKMNQQFKTITPRLKLRMKITVSDQIESPLETCGPLFQTCESPKACFQKLTEIFKFSKNHAP